MIKKLRAIAIEAGKMLTRNNRNDLGIRQKAAKDFVTKWDKRISAFVIPRLHHLVRDSEIMCEDSKFEKLATNRAKKVWVIDPIDGTTNFIHRYPFYTISITLFDIMSNRSVASVVFCPLLNQLFEAFEDSRSTLNGESIEVSKESNVNKCLLLTGFSHQVVQNGKELDIFRKMSCETHGTRRSGCASVDICYVAAGFAEAYYHFNLKPWDTLAAVHILRNAGGQVTNIAGSHFNPYQKTIIASNGKCHLEVNKLISTTNQ